MKHLWVLDASNGGVFRYDNIEGDIEEFVATHLSSDVEWMVSEDTYPVVIDVKEVSR